MEVSKMRPENDENMEKNKEVRNYTVNNLESIMEQSNRRMGARKT